MRCTQDAIVSACIPPTPSRMSRHRFGIHMDGIIEVLARNLYADPDVFVREMIQNAHDAVIKRLTADPFAPSGHIDIVSRPSERTLTFSDNGAGLSEAELHSYFSTI